MTLRTIRGFVQIVKEQDPDSAVNETLIRKLVKDGVIPSILNGNRRILEVEIALSALESMITECTASKKETFFSNEKCNIEKNNTYSIDPQKRAEAKLPKIKIV